MVALRFEEIDPWNEFGDVVLDIPRFDDQSNNLHYLTLLQEQEWYALDCHRRSRGSGLVHLILLYSNSNSNSFDLQYCLLLTFVPKCIQMCSLPSDCWRLLVWIKFGWDRRR